MDHVLGRYRGYDGRCKLSNKTFTYVGWTIQEPSITFEAGSVTKAVAAFHNAVDAHLNK